MAGAKSRSHYGIRADTCREESFGEEIKAVHQNLVENGPSGGAASWTLTRNPPAEGRQIDKRSVPHNSIGGVSKRNPSEGDVQDMSKAHFWG